MSTATTCPEPTPDTPPRGITPSEAGRLLRVSPDRIRDMIARGELGALCIPTRTGRPRFIILRHHLDDFEQRHRAAPPPKPPRRKRRPAGAVDFFPD